VEKKTFKNPVIYTHDDSWQISHSEGLGNPYGSFDNSEWDMEITFTKKLRDVEIGQGVYLYPKDDYPYQGTILWFDKRWALVDKSYGTPELISRDIIS
jgi:hypothetical protein